MLDSELWPANDAFHNLSAVRNWKPSVCAGRWAGTTPLMERLTLRRRAAAWTCIVCVVSVVAITILNLRDEVLRLLIQVLLLGASLLTGWYALTRCGLRRVVAAIISGVLLAVSLGGFFSGGRGSALSILSRIGLFVGAVSFGTFALGRENTAHFSTQRPGVAVPPAERGVLFINPNSGGGKADQANLVDACRLRGIDTVTLNQGDDLSVLARNAIASGADVIGMAGGDGSLGLVADVASKGGVAMVVVPAGTRNHFALDLGLDRSDLIGALDAYGHAVESQVDVGMVGDRVFLNNVSLGLYALIVSSPNYRNAKVKTTLATLPTVLGPDTEPFDLKFSTPDGAIHPRAHVLQISNNPYGNEFGTVGKRPKLDTGQLGIVALVFDGDRDIPGFLAALAARQPELSPAFTSWTAKTFVVTSNVPIDVGVDGESFTMNSPLTFSIRPGAVRIRLPRSEPHSYAISPIHWRDAAAGIWNMAMGRSTQNSGTEEKFHE